MAAFMFVEEILHQNYKSQVGQNRMFGGFSPLRGVWEKYKQQKKCAKRQFFWLFLEPFEGLSPASLAWSGDHEFFCEKKSERQNLEYFFNRLTGFPGRLWAGRVTMAFYEKNARSAKFFFIFSKLLKGFHEWILADQVTQKIL